MGEPEPTKTAPQGDSAQLDRVDWWAFRVTTGLTLLGYVFTLTPEVTLDWGGILTASAMYGGVGPPAGNPAWTIYSWFFIHLLPFSNPAWRVAVGSAAAGAVTCGLVALMVSRSAKILFAGNSSFSRLTTRDQDWIRRLSGYAAGMALGFSGAFWYEALVPDFVTFTALLFATILWLLMRWLETGRRRLCWWAFLLFGLLLTNAQEMVVALPGIVCAVLVFDRKFGRDLCFVLLPVAAVLTSLTQYRMWDYGIVDWPLVIAFAVAILIALIMIIVTRRLGTEWKSALACTLCFFAGMALYLDLPIISATNPPVNWAYPRDLEGFIHSIYRGQYEHTIPVRSFSMYVPGLWRMILQTGQNFGWPYLAFACIPFGAFFRASATGKKWIVALVLLALCVGPLLAALLNAAGDRQSQELTETYFLPLRVPLAVCTGMGLIYFATKMAPNPDELGSFNVSSANAEPN